MKKILDGKIVRFLALDRKYVTAPYPVLPPFSDKLNTYITGQHVDPDDPDTDNFLTAKEIIGEEEIKPAARKKLFPDIIKHDFPRFVIHGKAYDCRLKADNKTPVNTKDYAEAYFFISQKNLFSLSENEATPKQKFYLDDKEAKAKIFVIQKDTIYEAEKLIREKANISEYKEIVMLLNLSVPGFYIDYDQMSDNRLKEILIKQAHEDPKSITFAFSTVGKEYLFLAKLLDNGIIRKRLDGYYDGEKFIAIDASQFIAFIDNHDNEMLLNKWGNLLKLKEVA